MARMYCTLSIASVHVSTKARTSCSQASLSGALDELAMTNACRNATGNGCAERDASHRVSRTQAHTRRSRNGTGHLSEPYPAAGACTPLREPGP